MMSEHQTAIATASTSGIRLAIAQAFARSGMNVVLNRVGDPAAIEKLRADLVRGTGRRALAVGYHAASWGDADRLADTALAEFGRVDVLVNNAGMSPLYSSLDSISEDLYDKVMGVNLKGPFRLSAVIGAHMSSPGMDGRIRGGAIINVSSTASQRPSQNEVVYGAAKAGVNNLTVGLARTLGPKVRVNCIVPGPFLTDISKAWDLESFNKRAEAAFALGRGGEPHEIVGAALYLATAAGSYTSGTLVNVDGGPR